MKNIKKALYIADIHWPLHDKKCFDLYMQIAEAEKPDYLILLGDCFDAKGISKFTYSDYEDGLYDTVDELRGFRKHYFKPLVEACGKDVDVRWVLGNHDGERITKILERIEITCNRQRFLDYKNKLDLPTIFPEVKFTEYRKTDNIGKLYFTHGTYHNVAHPKKHAESYCQCIVYGHLHTYASYTAITEAKIKAHTGISIPCACNTNPDYMKNKPSSWVQGYAFAYHYPDGYFDISVKFIFKGRSILNGNLYIAR